MMQLPTHDDVKRAAARIAPYIVRTPMLRHRALDEACGGTVLLKPECLQRTGSFKLRGATNALMSAGDAARNGVVTFSSGNHGQAVASAAARQGVPATVFMPHDAPAVKRDATRAWGATIIGFDRARDNREELARTYGAQHGMLMVPPFDHPDVIAGQGTVALELAEDAANASLCMDMLLICTGGGGLAAGCTLAMDASPSTRCYAVEPFGWEDTAQSLAAGHRIRAQGDGSTFCDALLTPMPGALTFAINQPRLAGALAVTDNDVRAAMRFAFQNLKLVLEPGGAAALAALLAGRIDARGKVVGVTLSGGNVDAAPFAQMLQST